MSVQTDPFSSVRLKSLQPKNDQIHSENVQNLPKNDFSHPDQEDEFSNVRIKEAQGFPGIKEIGRHAARIGSRIGETILGIPGDISSLIQSGVFAGLEKLTGIETPKEAREEVKKHRSPTSSELKELSEKSTSGFTQAQGPTEKSIDEFVETASSLLGPMKFRRALGVSLGSQLSKEGIKISGLGDTEQEAGKLGTMFMLSAINPGGAMKYASSQYNKANSLSKGASIHAKNLKDNLSNMIIDLQKGVTTPGKNAVIKPAEELIGKIQHGKIPVHDLTSAKRDIHTLMGDPSLLKREKILLKKLGKEVDMAIKPYEKINPPFSKAYRPANEIYGAVMEGNKASKFISKVLGSKSILGATLAEAAMGHPEYILPTAVGAAGVLGTARSVDFFSRIIKSPELRKYYGKALVAAAMEDVGTLRLYADKIEKELEKPQSSSFSKK